jgi:hypothetical protein
VGVGVGLLVLLILVILGACWRLRTKRRRQQPSMRAKKVHSEDEGNVGTEYFEIEGSHAANELGAAGMQKGPWETGSGGVFEMDGSRGFELEDAMCRVEVEGSGVSQEVEKGFVKS